MKLVEKIHDPADVTKWEAQPQNWNEKREVHMIKTAIPGIDFVRIDTSSEEDAKEAATKYWNGTLADPGEIDAWVEEAMARKSAK